MKALESRKQLLIAESELNRAHLMHELNTAAGEVHALAVRAKSVGSIASVVAALVAVLSSVRHKESAPGAKKPWWQSLGKVAGLVSVFWAAFRSPPNRDGKRPEPDRQ